MASVFDVFKEVTMTYLTVDRGSVYGNTVTEETPIKGIFKLRSGMTSNNNMEAHSSSATVHVHPEDFTDTSKIIGNGIKHDGVDYEITGLTGGRNFDDGVMEHLTLTLEIADYACRSSDSESD